MKPTGLGQLEPPPPTSEPGPLSTWLEGESSQKLELHRNLQVKTWLMLSPLF